MYGTTYSMDIQEHFYSYAEVGGRYVSSRTADLVTDVVNDAIQPVIPESLQPTLSDPVKDLIKGQGRRLLEEATFRLLESGFKHLAQKEGVKRTVGTIGSRFIPYVGWALFAKDVYDVTRFVQEEYL